MRSLTAKKYPGHVLEILKVALIFVFAHCSVVSFAQSPQVYRDRVEPHWFNNNRQFWYRVDLPKGGREFVVVDTISGSRELAFDHSLVAASLSTLLDRPVSPDRLPVTGLKFVDDASNEAQNGLTLISGDGQFFLDRTSGTLTRETTSGTDSGTELFLPARPSGSSSEDTEIVVVNELNHTVRMFWIDGQGTERSYGEIAAGSDRTQHTFVSHSWLFQRSDGSPIGCVQAKSGSTRIVLNDMTIAEIRRSDERPDQRRRNRAPADASENRVAPDGLHTVFVRDHNLWLKNAADSSETQLSADGTAGNTFRRDASRARLIHMEYNRADYPDHLADVRWSPDAAFVIAFQTTQVDERRVTYVESTPADQLQPRLHSYPYLKPGDPIPQSRPRLFNITDRQEIEISNELFPNPWLLQFERWSDDGRRFWLLYNERGHQNLRLLEVTAETGAVRTVIDEHSETFIHYSSPGKMELRWLKNQAVLWASERSGWNHLYRYDLETASLQNAVTSGEWNVRRVEWLDEDRQQIWFRAVGLHDEQDPYHQHFCRVNLDGTGFLALTEGDGTHTIDWSPDRRCFIDRWSRVDQPPVTELRRADDGTLICSLESADAEEVIALRGRLPERFVAKGRDGQTDIWGIIYRPADFDPESSYPVIESIYAGPHDHHVPKAFQATHRCQSLADKGFIIVQIDGMGTAWRSRAFHDVCYRNLKDAGFPDRIAWIRAAAVQVPQMDLTRVGIYGGSAGGQNAMAALLWHHDFYSAAVADCGCHDNRMDKIWWNEQWMGIPEGDHYAANSNMENAALLQGRLMLVVGELDRNVDPATTTQVARKLIAADKDFDFVVIPGAGHGACETPWGSRRRTQFFVDALLQKK